MSVSFRGRIEGGQFQQGAQEHGLVDRPQARFDDDPAEQDLLTGVLFPLERRHGVTLLLSPAEPLAQALDEHGPATVLGHFGEIARPALRKPGPSPHR